MEDFVVKRLALIGFLVLAATLTATTARSDRIQLAPVSCRLPASGFNLNSSGHVTATSGIWFYCPIPVTNDTLHSTREYTVWMLMYDNNPAGFITGVVCTAGATGLYSETPRSACAGTIGTTWAGTGPDLQGAQTTSTGAIYRPTHVMDISMSANTTVLGIWVEPS
jgi:hypothetical protein